MTAPVPTPILPIWHVDSVNCDAGTFYVDAQPGFTIRAEITPDTLHIQLFPLSLGIGPAASLKLDWQDADVDPESVSNDLNNPTEDLWEWSTSDDEQYGYLTLSGGVQVHIKRETEGVVIDVWNAAQSEVIASSAISYAEIDAAANPEPDDNCDLAPCRR